MTRHMLPIVTQEPAPGSRQVRFCGDQVRFSLTTAPIAAGRAFLRTNLGHGRTSRSEMIRWVEANAPRLGRDWFDVPMTATGPGTYTVTIGLTEVGHFEGKCLFLVDGRDEPIWPDGPNATVNVEPAATCAANTLYNAFVRQFGPNKNGTARVAGTDAEAITRLDHSGHTVIPPSGTFRDVIAELDHIFHRLACRALLLLPIHPTPTTYGRMGRFGSPYAALSFRDVDPALAVFDPKATPMDQFLELVDGVHARNGKLMLDMAINHTGWAASLHESHPEWLTRDADGNIENPGAWGVVWADLTRLDYTQPALWQYMADALRLWCRRGVDGFRCDAGYMIPLTAWRYIIARVRDEFPDTVFFLEGLGGKVGVTRELLDRGNFNWAYSELFQNYDRGAIETHLAAVNAMSDQDGIGVHFAETHDNNRLAAVSPAYARMRTALCALTAPTGAFAFANGVEWLATEKINVHDAAGLNWGAADNQVAAIGSLNRLLAAHPAFGGAVTLDLVARGDGPYIALARRHRPSGKQVMVLVNLDMERSVCAGWDAAAGPPGTPLRDLLTDATVHVVQADGRAQTTLAAGQALCLGTMDDSWQISDTDALPPIPPAVVEQRLRAAALAILEYHSGVGAEPPPNPADAARLLAESPETFCRHATPGTDPGVVAWSYPHDLRRTVMIPPNHFLLVWADHPFRMQLISQDRVTASDGSLPAANGRHFVVVIPRADAAVPTAARLCLRVFTPTGTATGESTLRYLAPADQCPVITVFERNACCRIPLLVLDTDGRGAMMRVHADPWHLASRYDAMLAANLHPEHPVDRHVSLARCRAWIVFQGYSTPLDMDCLDRFGMDADGRARWEYHAPTGQGEHVRIHMTAWLQKDLPNTLHMVVHRATDGIDGGMADADAVTLIVRPDIEDRNFHDTTKAYLGPENRWPNAVTAMADGFRFAPNTTHCLVMTVSPGTFGAAPEWQYMVHRPMEAQRGLDANSDLFSPGYFSTSLTGGQAACFTARVRQDADPARTGSATVPVDPGAWTGEADQWNPMAALTRSARHFIVQRDRSQTVIAGYPWFLDWGRDTLIAVRGLAASGFQKTCRDILVQFARFEDRGTLPNMIRGDDAGNRDTSDAPLWFFTACADTLAAGDTTLPAADCNGRPLRRVLVDMADALITGTPNGVVMDPDSGLIFSPSHFTWMDTNHPAGTPREGYPVEIQALWLAALRLLAEWAPSGKSRWNRLADQVAGSIDAFFWNPELGYLGDCRHGGPGTPAREARLDDALRPNQLLAITLGAVTAQDRMQSIVDQCRALIVPGAIRSLADRPVTVPLAIHHNGRSLNAPLAPYWGVYAGDEDTRRKPAYHNGTAWTWLFPSFCEAWAMAYGPDARETALAWLASSIDLVNTHCIGQMPEILDGDAPHPQRGCDAQAWGVTELLRVWRLLGPEPDAGRRDAIHVPNRPAKEAP